MHGQVQGVGFRWNTRSAAQRFGVSGWVRNLPDGSVEVQIEGDEASVEALTEWLRHGPPFSDVTRVEITETDPTGEGTFEIRDV